jgi:hypothetical protein
VVDGGGRLPAKSGGVRRCRARAGGGNDGGWAATTVVERRANARWQRPKCEVAAQSKCEGFESLQLSDVSNHLFVAVST